MKAFDTVDHNILLRKLHCYGVNGNALQLHKTYLTGRTQICYVNGVLSTEQFVSCGIPQGSILGPPVVHNLYKRFSQMSAAYNAWYVGR